MKAKRARSGSGGRRNWGNRVTEFRFGEHDTGEVLLRFAAGGDPAGPLVILLHGFPELWIGWREVMRGMALDFHVVAPDQRGYGGSSVPAGVEAYRARHLVADIASLADRLSPDRPFVLAGHDWGASVAYAFAMAHPERLTHLVVANGIHPACFQRALFDNEAQRRASQYINWLKNEQADALLAEDDYRRLMRMITGFSPAQWMTPDVAAEYRAAWRRPGVLTGMLNWYRASPVLVPASDADAPASSPILDMPDEALTVKMPHLVIWGDADVALLPVCLDGLPRYAPDLKVEHLAGCGHWVLHERPAEVAAAIRTFVGG